MNNLLHTARQKIMRPDDLAAEVRRRQSAGERGVFTNGCFDLLHLGHVRYLQDARTLGNFLILGLNSDTSVRQYKGPGRPLVPEMDRAEILAALTCVDYVAIFPEVTACSLVELLRPAIYVKGGDYIGADNSAIDTRRAPEAKVALSYGGSVHLIPYLPNHSTSELITAIKALPEKSS